jgi:hypothetical protein
LLQTAPLNLGSWHELLEARECVNEEVFSQSPMPFRNAARMPFTLIEAISIPELAGTKNSPERRRLQL